MHIFHKWGRWAYASPVTKRFQSRECLKCGKVQERQVPIKGA